MQIKVFSASKLHEALAQAREGLGPDAVILDRMQGLDLEGKKIWHVHAALDDRPDIAAASMMEDQKKEATDRHLATSMQRLERIVEGLGRQEVNNFRDAIEDKGSRAAFDYLLKIGVASSFAFDIAESYANQQSIDAPSLRWAERIYPDQEPVVMLLVGPSGAGKTTLAAKLATHYSLKGIKVGIISTDADRMGGTDVIKSYADILGAPFVTLRSQEAVPEALKKMNSAQLVLVDTEGWNLRRMTHARKQSKIWDDLACTHKVLVMPANMDEEDGLEMLAKAEDLNISQLAFTKVDETLRPGKIVNWATVSEMSLSYCSFGPDVPEQMGWLTPQALTTLLGSQENVCLKEVA
ncbi:MAG: GTP-binding protein [Mariprofundaceae bacterium]